MEPINILDARNNLSRLIAAASAGEQVVISKRGVPVARLIAAEDQMIARHSASEVSAWLSTNPVPTAARRTASDLDEQIASEREGWE